MEVMKQRGVEQLREAFSRADRLDTGSPDPAIRAWLEDTSVKTKWQSSQDLWNVVNRRLQFMRDGAIGVPLPEEDLDRWAQTLRWLIDELRAWHATEHERLFECMTTLVADQDVSGRFWDYAPDDIGRNAALIECLADKIGSVGQGINIEGNFSRHVTAAKAEYEKADREQDWPTVLKYLRRMNDAADYRMTQIVRFLLRFGRQTLIAKIQTISHAAVANSVLIGLDDATALALANDAGNPYIDFAAGMRIALRREPIDSEAAESAVALLCRVGRQGMHWRSWMKAFCHHPGHHDQFHKLLGRALGQLPVNCAEEYIQAINPWSYQGSGRQAVSECLREFRSVASSEDQKSVWKAAYNCWTSYDFGKGSLNEHLPSEQVTCLDFAVVGYFVDCFTLEQLDALLAELYDQVRDLPLTWFADMAACSSEFLRLMSRLQPLAHARTIQGSDADWLMVRGSYGLPPGLETKYFKIQFPFGRLRNERVSVP